MSVDLPDPFWPRRAWISPASTVEVDAVERPLPGEGLGQAEDLQHRAAPVPVAFISAPTPHSAMKLSSKPSGPVHPSVGRSDSAVSGESTTHVGTIDASASSSASHTPVAWRAIWSARSHMPYW